MNKKFILSCLFIFIATMSFAKDSNMWYRFEDPKTNLIGFKNANGEVKIAPKFTTFIPAEKFDKIIAVVEETENNKYENYYLTKTGKKVGIDSLYIFDNTPDCESEGFIRFKDKDTNKTGLMDGDGNIVIPPIYNNLSKVHNGMIFALKGALTRKDGEYTFFIGGVESLIDTQNTIIIENLKYDENINLYSITIEDTNQQPKSVIRDYFKGANGKTYSFINYKKEFQDWIESILLQELKTEKIKNHFFHKISYWDDTQWSLIEKNNLSPEIIDNIINKLGNINKNVKYNIFLQDFNPYIFEGKEFETFFDNCKESITTKYPVMNIVIEGSQNGQYVQDHFEFLRTQDGYKLIRVSIKSD